MNIHLLFGPPKISLDYHLHMSLSDSGDFVALNATAIPGMDGFFIPIASRYDCFFSIVD